MKIDANKIWDSRQCKTNLFFSILCHINAHERNIAEIVFKRLPFKAKQQQKWPAAPAPFWSYMFMHSTAPTHSSRRRSCSKMNEEKNSVFMGFLLIGRYWIVKAEFLASECA